MTRQMAAVSLIFVGLATGCARQPKMTPASAPAPTGSATAGSTTAPSMEARPADAPAARASATPGRSDPRPKITEYTEHADLTDIHFAFDRYDLRDGGRRILDGHAEWLKKNTGVALLVEGHCDERGTAEYNISLGERRAKATANYLQSRGVAPARITIVSYGEQRPACREQAETCWSRNRRAHFRVKQQ